MAGDVNYSSVALLLPCDGAVGSTVFTDRSPIPKTATANGAAKIGVALEKTSAEFRGIGDYISVADHADLDLGAGDITIECEVYLNGISPTDVDGGRGAAILSTWSSDSVSGYVFNLSGSTSDTGTGLAFDTWSASAGVATLFRATFPALPKNAWHAVAVTVQGGVRRLFVNGLTQPGVATSLGGGYAAASSFGRVLTIGRTLNSAYPIPLNGNVRNLRITKGVARHTTDYTPGGVFSNGRGEVAGVVRDAAGNPVARTVRVMRRDTGAVLSTVSDAATGKYLVAVPTLDEVVRIVHSDTTTAPLENDLIDRVIPA